MLAVLFDYERRKKDEERKEGVSPTKGEKGSSSTSERAKEKGSSLELAYAHVFWIK